MSCVDKPEILKCPYCKKYLPALSKLHKYERERALLRCMYCGGIALVSTQEVKNKWEIRNIIKLSDTQHKLCGNCTFWEYTPLSFVPDSTTSGLCHKYAAGIYLLNKQYIPWPYAPASGWCGEYKPAGQETNSKTEEK